MKTKLFTFFLAFASVGIMFAEKVQIGDLYYNLDANNKTAEVTNQNGSNWPWWSITITTAQIPTTVIYNDVTYSVTSIGDQAFRACVDLTSVTIPNSIISIGKSAFNNCVGLTSIEIPNSVISIGEGAFFSCNGLTSINIPNSVTTIGEEAFALCSGLTSINISNRVTSIESKVFSGCGLTSIKIPESVTSIGARAFEHCGLTSIKIPESVTNIGDYAFYECSNLTSVTIPNSVTSIGEFAFLSCSGLTSPVFNVHVFAFMPKTYSGAYTIPDGIKSIAGGAFYGCAGLTSIEIPESVTSIGDYAFSGCISLPVENNLRYAETYLVEAVDKTLSTYLIKRGTRYIGSKAFSGCRSLTTIEIPNSVTCIKDDAFEECSSLTSITIPTNVTNIGSYAFLRCTLSSVTCEAATPPTIKDNTFTSSNYSAILFVPEESIEVYQNELYWENFTDIRAIINSPIVQFLDWDGTVLSSAYVDVGSAAIPPANPSREGYTFIGWDKDFNNITEDLIVTAQYKINRYEVIFEDWDETILKTDSVDYNNPAYAPANPSREGHEFIGWDKDYSHVTSDMTIKAQYAVNYYAVEFLNYDGTLLSEQSIEYNQAAMAPIVPARDGYTFVGWTADIEHIVARTFAIALYEKRNLLLVTYKKEDGEIISSENVDLHLPEAPSITGKTFAGWLTESASNTEGVVFRATYTLDNPTESGDVTVEPSSTTARVAFPYITGAMTYVLVIRDLFGHVVCKILFNSTGHLLGIAFAPGHNNAPQQEQSTGFNFTVEGLTPNTTYEYEFTAHDDTDEVIETLSGSFTTTAEVPTDNEQVNSPSAVRKYLEDGHLMIDNNSQIFDARGQQVK